MQVLDMILWHDDAEDLDPDDDGEHERCTPEKLLAFIRTCVRFNGKQPTLLEIKRQFGGILGPMVDYWKLKDQGLI